MFHPGQFDSTGALLRDTNIYTVEVHNHGAARFCEPLTVLVCVISNFVLPLVEAWGITILSRLLFVGQRLFTQILRRWEFRIIRTTSNLFQENGMA